MSRPTADIVADLRGPALADYWCPKKLADEVAKRLEDLDDEVAELRAHLLLLTSPLPGGKGYRP